MKLIAAYPIQENAAMPHCGKPVVAVTHHGDRIIGILDKVENGQAMFKPLRHEANVSVKKAKTKQYGYGYPGWGAGYGFGSIAIPLILLAALFSYPFFI